MYNVTLKSGKASDKEGTAAEKIREGSILWMAYTE